MDKPLFLALRARTSFIVIAAIVVLLVGSFIALTVSTFHPTTQVHLGSGIYALKLAQSKPDLTQGLSDTPSIKMNGGLLMDFEYDGYHGIWMKDMNYPLDIVWLNKAKEVVYIVKNAPPEDPVETVYTPKDLARYVLELPAGSVQKSGIRTGMVAKFNIDV